MSHAQVNRTYWNGMAHDWVAAGERAWASEVPSWGSWGLPDRDVTMIPEDMTGMRAVELGCGTGYVSAWMCRRGARVVAVDMSEKQLATAQRLSRKHAVSGIQFVHGNAESVPLAAGSCDFAISEYGAAIWCDPRVWIPEAHRLLKPGGRLAFLGTTPLVQCCMPLNGAAAEPTLHRDYFGMHEIDWQEVEIDPGGVEFNLPISSWLRLFRSVGFAVEDYLELQAPADAPSQAFAIPADWARRWPSEQVWKLRRI